MTDIHVRTSTSLIPMSSGERVPMRLTYHPSSPHPAHPKPGKLCPQVPQHLLLPPPSKARFKFRIIGLPRVPCQKAVVWAELLLATACSPLLLISGSAPHQQGETVFLGSLMLLCVVLTMPWLLFSMGHNMGCLQSW